MPLISKKTYRKVRPKLLQRVRLAHFSRRNCYQLLSDITGMPDISLPFILLYDCNNFIWSFRFFACVIIWIIFKKYAASQDYMTDPICAILECKSRHGKHENFEVFLNSHKFSEIFLETFQSTYYSEFSKILTWIFWNVFRNILIYFSRFYEIFIKILHNNSRLCSNSSLKIFSLKFW